MAVKAAKENEKLALKPVRASELKKFSMRVFVALGATKEIAGVVTEHLIEASLRGVDSHGVSRIPVYAQGVVAGDIDATATPQVVKETATTALVDGRQGFGQVGANYAIGKAISKARANGISTVAMKNSNHVGMLAIYGERIALRRLIAKICVNGMARVAPYGSREKVLGTNPICFAFPAGRVHPIIVDIATSATAAYKIVLAAKEGRQIPLGWAVNSSGKPTTDAEEALGGALLPVGGHKGFGLGLSVEIMSAILAGAPLSVDIKPVPHTQGGFFVEAMRTNLFRPEEAYNEEVAKLVRAIKRSKVAKGFDEVLLPGEPERIERARRISGGIPIGSSLWEDFEDWSQRLDVPLPCV